MNWIWLIVGLFIGATITVTIMACLVASKGNPPTNWRGEEPYEDD